MINAAYRVVLTGGYTGGDEIAVERAPPGARLGPNEIGKDAHPRPDLAPKRLAVLGGDEVPARDPLVVGVIALLFLDAWIDDHHGPKTIGAEIGHGGVVVFVVIFAMYPLGLRLLQEANIPKRLFCAAFIKGIIWTRFWQRSA